MFVNLTEVLLNEGRTVTMQIEPELAQVTVGGETYPVSGRAAVTLTIRMSGKGRRKSGEKAESCSAPAAADVLRTWRRHWSL